MRPWRLFRRPDVRAEPLAVEARKEVSERPRSVRALLTEMKDISELTIDLAWAAIAFDSRAFAAEVETMNLRMDRLLYEIRIAVMLSARDRRSAEQLAGLLQVANAAEDLAEAADELVQLLDADLDERLELPFMMKRADEIMHTAEVHKDDGFDLQTLRDLLLESKTGVRVVALKRTKRWIFGIDADQRLKAGDLLMCRADSSGYQRLAELLDREDLLEGIGDVDTAPSESSTTSAIVADSEQNVRDPVDLFLAMKEMSELMVDLAYSALLFDNKGIATEVHYLDEEMDDNLYDLQRLAVDGVAVSCRADENIEAVSPDRALALLRLGGAVEAVAAAARSIADVTLRDIDAHPVLAASVRDAESTVLRIHLDDGTTEDVGDEIESVPFSLTGDFSSLGILRLSSNTGLWIIAIRRKGKLIFEMDRNTNLQGGDVLILQGPVEGLDRMRELFSPK